MRAFQSCGTKPSAVLVFCWLKEKPCTSVSSADMSDHQSLRLCSKLLLHDMCLNSFSNRRSVWSINADTRRGCSKQAHPARHAVTLFAKCVCVYVCACLRARAPITATTATRPFGCFRVFSAIVSSIVCDGAPLKEQHV